MMRDQSNHLKPVPAIAPAVVTDNTAQVSAIIDIRGFHALTFLIVTGTLSDADTTLTVLVEHGDAANLSDAAAVADEELIGTEAGAAITFADDGKAFKIGYRGIKRYVRLTVTPANNTGNIPIAAVAVLGLPSQGFLTDQSP